MYKYKIQMFAKLPKHLEKTSNIGGYRGRAQRMHPKGPDSLVSTF